MKYFKCTNKADPEEVFYTSSSSDATTTEDVSKILDLENYQVEECSGEEFERETEEDDPKAEALELLDEIKACLYSIEDFGEQGGYIDEPVMEYLDTLNEKVSELILKVQAI